MAARKKLARRRYVPELDALRRDLGLDYEAFSRTYKDRYGRVAQYERVKDHLIRGEVILTFLLVDEFLNLRIHEILFPDDGPSEPQVRLSEVLDRHVVLQLPLRRKIEFVDEMEPLPKPFRKFAWTVAGMRNALAHEFYRRDDDQRTRYKGKDVYTREGLERFVKDADEIRDYHVRMGGR